MLQKQNQSLVKKSNRRPLNEDGSIPQCLVCGKDALKHFNRKRWHDTCGSKECSEHLRLTNMRKTKSAPEYAEKAKVAAHKTVETKRATMIEGQTLMEQTANKIRKANLVVDHEGLSGYERASRKAAPKVRISNENNGHWTRFHDKTEFNQYRTKVSCAQRKFKKQIQLLENYEKRAPSGEYGAYHIDHRISVWFGFVNGIPPEIIGHICNLQMKHWLDNNRKWSKCDMALEELLEAIRAYEERNK